MAFPEYYKFVFNPQVIGKPALAATPVTYTQGIVDWSGTHLTSIGDMIQVFLAKRMDLGGNAVECYALDRRQLDPIAQRIGPLKSDFIDAAA